MEKIEKLVDNICNELYDCVKTPTYDELLDLARLQVGFLGAVHKYEFSEDEILQAVSKVQTRHDTVMGLGNIFYDSVSYHPWLADKKASVDFYYWGRYRKLLKPKRSMDELEKFDNITDKILDHLEDPTKNGAWTRKGLVVGDVQSGKTANFIGVMCKAADVGYKVIIVLGGLLNSLRSQSQQRIDSDFLGFCTKTKKLIGVSKFADSRRPFSLTTSCEDFKKSTANSVQLDLNALNEPVILVIKKNVTTLKNLRDWLKDSNKKGLSNYPMLLIDDEADHASVNTNREDQNPTAINRGIRELLSMFPRHAYLGYTATPFANIFIDPDSEDEMENGEEYKDLFPRDFILNLEAPSNYVGANEIFGDNSTVLREIWDSDTFLPLDHKKDFVPYTLPPSLFQAINCFMLIKTIRELDGQKEKHHSMMINASRFTDVQERLKSLVSQYLKKCQRAIKNYAGLSESEALKESSVLRDLKMAWEKEFSHFNKGWTRRSFSWSEVQHHLNESVSSIVVLSINDDSTDRLDYDEYPTGRSIIAVGGLGLSRGLTLEGLSVSYFLRNSIMYDTLLQMGRWFGYRDGYKDLCRVFMLRKSISWYQYIASAVEELRDDFEDMEKVGLTPLDFGLKVRSHPGSLIVTARNKMRSTDQFVAKIALAGHFVETSCLINNQDVFAANRLVLERAVRFANAEKSPEKDTLGWLWKGVSLDVIKTVVSDFRNAPDCFLTTKEPLLDYIEWLEKHEGVKTCDLLLRGKCDEKGVDCFGFSFSPITRSLENQNFEDSRLTFIKRHIISRGDEAAGLTKGEIDAICENYSGENVPDREFRKFKATNGNPPLLVLVFAHVFASQQELNPDGKKKRFRVGDGMIVPAYGISFPGDSMPRERPKKLVSYVINKVCINGSKNWNDASNPDEECK